MDAKEMTVGGRVRMIRNMNRMNQSEFGKEIHVSTTTVCQLEGGKSGMSRATKYSLCSRFCINPQWLETGEGEMYAEADTQELLPALAAVMKDNPAILRAVEKVVRSFLPDDWRKLDGLLRKLEEGA